MSEKEFSWGDYVGSGWSPIVNDLYERVIAIEPNLRVEQVKEKFGGLRFYYSIPSPEDNLSDEEYNDEWDRRHNSIDNLIREAESLCYQTCESCGSKDSVKTDAGNGYWLKTFCAICRDKIDG